MVCFRADAGIVRRAPGAADREHVRQPGRDRVMAIYGDDGDGEAASTETENP